MKSKRKIDNNCEKATFLIEKKQLSEISLTDAVELQIHLAGCYECRVFQKQSELINIICRKVLNEPETAHASLDETFKIALQHRINLEVKKK